MASPPGGSGPSQNIRAAVADIEALRKIAAFRYPGLTLIEVLSKLLEPGLRQHEKMLAQIAELERQNPGLSLDELRALATDQGLDLLTRK